MAVARFFLILGLAVAMTAGLAGLFTGLTSLQEAKSELGYSENLSKAFHTSLFPISDGRYVVFLESIGQLDGGSKSRLAILDAKTGLSHRFDQKTSDQFTLSLMLTSERAGRLLAAGNLVADDGVLDLASKKVSTAPWPTDFRPRYVSGSFVYGDNGSVGWVYRLDGHAAFSFDLRDVSAACAFEVPILAATATHVLVQDCMHQEDQEPEIRQWIIDVRNGNRQAFDLEIDGFVTRFVAANSDYFVLVSGEAVLYIDVAGQQTHAIPFSLADGERLNSFAAHGDDWVMTSLLFRPDGLSDIILRWGTQESAQVHAKKVGVGFFLSGLVVRAEPVDSGIVYHNGVDIFLSHPGEGRLPWLPILSVGAFLTLGSVLGGAAMFGSRNRFKARISQKEVCRHCRAHLEPMLSFCAACGHSIGRGTEGVKNPPDEQV
jgi:hypothetical protein